MSTTRPVKPSAAATKLSTVEVVVYWVSPVPSPVTADPVVPVDPGGQQAVPDGGQVTGVHRERERAPADGRGERLEVQRADVVDVGGRAYAGQRHARVGGDALGLADAGHDLERARRSGRPPAPP